MWLGWLSVALTGLFALVALIVGQARRRSVRIDLTGDCKPMGIGQKRKELVGLVGAIGVVVAMAGFVGGYLRPAATIVWTFGIWIVGTMLVRVFTDPPGPGGGK